MVEQQPGRRPREFSSNACRQRYHRATKRQSVAMREGQQAETLTRRVRELEAENAAQRAEIERLTSLLTDESEQGQEIARLKHLLDVDRWYRTDTARRNFKAWLRKQPATSLSTKILDNALFPNQGSRAQYEAYLRREESSADELHEFANLWKALLQSM